MKRIELLGKKLLRGALRGVIPNKQRNPNELNPADIKKILVVRQDNRIGNLVLQIPLIKALKDTFSKAEITVLMGKTFSELYVDIPEVQNRIIFPHRELARHPWRWLSLVRDVGRGGWDLALECGHPHVVSLNNASLTYMSKAPFRAGFRRGDSDIFLNVQCEPPERMHYAKTLKAMISPWNSNQAAHPLSLPVPDIHKDAWKRLWERAELEGNAKVVLIWSGGRYGKRWQVDVFGAIASSILNAFDSLYTPVIGLGPGERELESAFSNLPNIKTIRFDGPVEELWAFMDRCWAVISGDTGPMHLATALGVPTFALFRVNNVWEYGHDDDEYHRAIYDTDNDLGKKIIDFLNTFPETTCPRSTMYY